MSFLIFSIAWLMPNHYMPWVNFHSEFLTFLGLAALVFALIRKSPSGFAIPAIAIGAFALAAIPWTHYAVGVVFFAGDAFISSTYSICLAIAIAVGYKHSQINGGVWRLPAQVLLTAAGVSSLLAVLQWLSLTDAFTTFMATTDVGDRAMANLGQPNQLGTLLLMGLAALLFLFELRCVGHFVLALSAFPVTWAIVLTGSRTATVSALVVVSFLVFKLHTAHRSAKPMRLRISYLALWSVIFAVGVQVLPWVNGALLLNDFRVATLWDSNGRSVIWLQTLYAIYESPWWGYGWNQTPVAQAAGALHHPGNLQISNAHNVILDLLAWVGIPLGVLITACFSWWLFIRIRAVNSTAGIFAMAMLLPFLVHSMFEFPFAYAYFLLMAGLLIGVVESDCATTRCFLVPKPVAAFGLAVMTAVGGYAAYEYLRIEEDYRVARFENLKVGRTPDDHVRPDILIHTQLAAMLATLRQPAVPNMTSEQFERLRKVSLRFGARSMVFRYAVALGLNGQPAAAARQMQVFRGMFGERAYQIFKLELRQLQAEKYPELAAVLLP